MSVPSYKGTEIPVVSVCPDWTDSVELSLSESTGIYEALDTSEERLQRYARPLAAISFNTTEVGPVAQGKLRKLFELAGSMPFAVPLWTEQVQLSADVLDEETTLAVTNTTGTLFTNYSHLILWADADDYEVLAYERPIFNGELVLTDPTTRAWPAGTKVCPVAFGYCKRPTFTAITAEDSVVAIEFEERFLFAGRREYDLFSEIDTEITYGTCNEEITVAFGAIPTLENVTISFGESKSGPWVFWGETRQPVTEVTVGNYFAGKWLKIEAETSLAKLSIATFQPLPPEVLPPGFTVEWTDYHGTFFDPPEFSAWGLIYAAQSALDPEREVAAVYPGNLNDPETNTLAYTVPLFSQAFVEVGPRYMRQAAPGGVSTNNAYRVTLSSAQSGAVLKFTTDGSNPSLMNGFTTQRIITPTQDGAFRSVVIARAFKDGCQSPPVYIPVDVGRETTGAFSSTIAIGEGGPACYCMKWIRVEVTEDNCTVQPWGNTVGPYCNASEASPCPPPSDPTLEDLALMLACDQSATQSNTNQGMKLAGVNTYIPFQFWSPPNYSGEGPDPGTCPSAPWGGGQYRIGLNIWYLKGFAYSWNPGYAGTPADDLYLMDSTATIEGTPTDFPETETGREQISNLTGANGGSTNNAAQILFDSLPGLVKTCPGNSGASGTLTRVNITQTVVNR